MSRSSQSCSGGCDETPNAAASSAPSARCMSTNKARARRIVADELAELFPTGQREAALAVGVGGERFQPAIELGAIDQGDQPAGGGAGSGSGPSATASSASRAGVPAAKQPRRGGLADRERVVAELRRSTFWMSSGDGGLRIGGRRGLRRMSALGSSAVSLRRTQATRTTQRANGSQMRSGKSSLLRSSGCTGRDLSESIATVNERGE